MKNKLFLFLAVSFLLVGCGTQRSKSDSSSIKDSESSLCEDCSSSFSSSSDSEDSNSGSSSSSNSDSSSSETPTENEYDYDGYYANLSWNNSEDLINKLHNIISQNYTSQKYAGNWTINQNADQALDDLEMVDLLYSKEKDLKTNTYANGKGWQREHAFAASLMTGFTTTDAVGVGNGRATDFHNLFAASNTGNGSRGNKNFGIADPNAEDLSYQEKDDYKSDSKNFEPSNTDKGILSRAIFYMAVMFNQEEQQNVKTTLTYSEEDKITFGKASTTITVPVTYQPLKVVEEYVPYTKFTYTNWYYHNTKPESMEDAEFERLNTLVEQYGEGVDGYARYSEENCQFAIGNLSTLLTWSDLYTVDYGEMQHNNYVHNVSGQGNRYPFVDFPELVSYAFGENKNTAGSLKDLHPSYIELGMDKNEINHYAIKTAKREYDSGSTFSHDDYTIVGIKNDLSEVPASYTDVTEEYTFTDADAAAGKKELTIKTPINDIKFNVKVNSGSLSSCSYQGLVVNVNKNQFSNGGTTNVDGVDWKTSWTNETGAMGSKDSTYGLAFGVASGGKTMHELTLETTTSKTVNMIYLKGSCKTDESIDYTIMVGETVVSSGTITRIKNVTVAPEVVGSSFETISGKVKIVISGSGATNGAIYIHTLAFNEVK